MLDTAIRPDPATPATWHALARQLRVDERYIEMYVAEQQMVAAA